MLAGAAALAVLLAAPSVLASGTAPAADPAAAQAAETAGETNKIGPRPLTEAERAAVELALAYLDGGPETWLGRLAEGSPLAQLGRDEALAEIEVRAGPPLEAEWQLQTLGPGQDPNLAVFTLEFPSGIDETLTLNLAEDGAGGWRIAGLRCLVDRVPSGPVGSYGIAKAGSPLPPGAAPVPPASRTSPIPPPSVLALAALLAAGLLAGRRRGIGPRRPVWPRNPAVAAVWAAVLVVAGLVVLAACGRGGSSGSKGPEKAAGGGAVKAPAFERLGALVPLRRALADGTDTGRILAALDAAPSEGLAGEVVRLWRAEQRLWRAELREAEKLLITVPIESRIPLAELLRARLALLRGDATGADDAYHRVLALGPDHDGARMEMAAAQSYLDTDGSAEVTFQLLGEMGSRLAEAYYAIAEVSAIHGEPDQGEDAFRIGWQLNPVERAEIFDNPGLSHLAARPTLFPTFGFGSPEEPRVEPPPGDRRPVALPEGAVASLAGELLRVSVGSSRLTVPGGWTLAPAGAAVEDAASERLREEERALARLPSLIETAGGSLVAHPRRREQATAAALALARHNRWPELIELTDSLDALLESNERLPPLLARLRALALKQVDRVQEAKVILFHLAKRDLVDKRRDPGNLIQLGELFAATGEYEVAIRLLRKAGSMSPYGIDDHRIMQLNMDREMESAFASWESRHFAIRYPRATGDKYPRQLNAVLVAERQRLRRWIPVGTSDERIEVALFPVLRFLEAYGGGIDVVGIYDGRVRVPFADLQSLNPVLVRILTHELAHAMIAEVTHDQAPHWFQEGLAQHVEMGTGPINLIPDLARTSRLIAFPMIDPVLRGFSEPQLVELAYSESAWAIHFIESRFGVDALHRMQRAFASGMTTDEALSKVLHMTSAEFDRAAWDWCRFEAPNAWVNRERRYDREYDSLIERTELADYDQEEPPPPARQAVIARPQRGNGPVRPGSDPTREPAGRAKPGSAPLTATRESMAAWHRTYASRTVAVKRALGTVLPLLNGGDKLKIASTCGQLSAQVRQLFDDPAALVVPDAQAGRQLRFAYESVGRLAEACREGDLRLARGHLSRVQLALSRAAGALAPYGLEP